MRNKYFIPNDFRDFLSIFSFVGFLGIFMFFTFSNTWITDNTTGIFLIFGGAAFLVIGKAITFRKWIRDGIQQNEISLLIALIFGLSAMIMGFLLIFNMNIPNNLWGYIGILALVPAIYILIDYVAKNK